MALKQRFSKAQMEANTKEQNPDFTLLCNPEVRPHAITEPQGGF
jgi:hypothetical protein